ncbi:MAG: ABC transporter ATP-binding protein [Patescibacteria group bacterium]|nr:MAG: ABC transporter ATP-binding protein [Patescibacteria group bacterium]
MLDDMSDFVIKAENLTKEYRLNKQRTFKEFLPALFYGQSTYVKFKALQAVNFELKKGESLAILGRNGSGKSTLLKIIAGVTKPSDGRITVLGKVAPLIELGAGFHPELTGKENVYLNGSILGIRKKQMDRLYKSIVDFSELHDFMDQPVKFYSSGMYMRLAFSVAVAEKPEILLVDEILAVGDIKFREKCLARIKEFQKQGATLVLVTHSPEQALDYTEKTLVLHQGKQIFFGETKEGVKIINNE